MYCKKSLFFFVPPAFGRGVAGRAFDGARGNGHCLAVSTSNAATGPEAVNGRLRGAAALRPVAGGGTGARGYGAENV